MSNYNNPINWQDILRITNNKHELAKEMITMFSAELPGMRENINKALQKKDYLTLLNQTHKLHGSCCYCGAQNLKTITARIEENLKQNQYQNLSEDILQLNNEINSILSFIKNEFVKIWP